MSVEFIGMIGTQPASEIHPPRGPAIDVDYVRQFTQAHEQSGFDRILIGYFSNGADGFIVAQYAAFVTEKLGLMVANRARTAISSRMTSATSAPTSTSKFFAASGRRTGQSITKASITGSSAR